MNNNVICPVCKCKFNLIYIDNCVFPSHKYLLGSNPIVIGVDKAKPGSDITVKRTFKKSEIVK